MRKDDRKSKLDKRDLGRERRCWAARFVFRGWVRFARRERWSSVEFENRNSKLEIGGRMGGAVWPVVSFWEASVLRWLTSAAEAAVRDGVTARLKPYPLNLRVTRAEVVLSQCATV
jgi:hypothetical protein